MKKYLLIDNCSLRHLVNSKEYSNEIQNLENLIHSDEIEIITHELVIEEWNKHKDKWKSDTERKIKYFNSPNANSLLPTKNNINNLHLEYQYNKIDEILENSSHKLSTYEIIKNETYDRIRNKLAPFHSKKDSLSDWEILGSTAHFCELNGIKNLYFISHNHTDFADTINNERIHPSLNERFNKTNIIYFRDIQTFLNNYQNTFSHNLISIEILPNPKFSFSSSTSSNVLDAMYNLFKTIYSEINFIPIHILRKKYPFSTNEYSEVYYSLFALNSVNDDLITFFDNININPNYEIEFKDKSLINFIKDYEIKTKYILQHLSKNLVFFLSGTKNEKRIYIHYYPKSEDCNCIKCCFDRFEFSKVFQSLSNNVNDSKEKLKLAYIHYHLGNFQTANFIYEEILVQAIERKEYLVYFIVKYNQRHLAQFLNNPFINKEINYDLIEILKKIDPLFEASNLKGKTDYNFLKYVVNEDYFNDAFQEISDIVNKITEHYYIQLNGGFSSNAYIRKLINEFAKLDYFLNNNYIIYDYFINFNNLFELITKGIFASHAISEKQSSRFEYFDDYWITKFIFYGESEIFIKYFSRFNLKSLKYKHTDNHYKHFVDLLDNILNEAFIIGETMDKYADRNNIYFDSMYNKFFRNVITFSALLVLDKKSINQIAIKLLEILKSELKFHRKDYKVIELFLENKFKIINNQTLVKYLSYFINGNICYNIQTLEIIIDCFDDDSLDSLKIKEIERILDKSINVCVNCNQTHDYGILISLYHKLHPNKKNIISSGLKKKLDTNFDFDIYYNCVLNDIIEGNSDFVISKILKFQIPKKQNKNILIQNINNYYIGDLDDLINISFKLNIDTKDKVFNKFKKINLYYRWLLDMENFNYKYFDIEWILKYRINYYYKKMSESPKLIEYLRNYLKSNLHIGIERVLNRITNFK